MLGSSMYVGWHAAHNHPLAGLSASYFVVGALASAGWSVYATLADLAEQARHTPGCCSCSLVHVVLHFQSIREEYVPYLQHTCHTCSTRARPAAHVPCPQHTWQHTACAWTPGFATV